MATRYERVVLDLEDRFSRDMTKAAGATQLLNRELGSLSANAVAPQRGLRGTTKETASLGRESDSARASIDRLSGRLAILTRVAAVLGPGLSPIAASTVPAIAGLATQLGFSVAAAGTAVLAFQGVGDALKAVREAQLDPTTEKLDKAREAMRMLSPAARELVVALRDMAPQFAAVRDAAASGLFPGLIESLDDVESLLPQVERIVRTVGDATGDLLAGGAAELASSEWEGFFDYLESEADPVLTTFGQTVGNLTKGLAEMVMALDPASDDFGAGFLALSERFESWAEGLSGSEGFESFLAYVQETGPQVLDTLGALGTALLDIGVAAAPLGGPVLTSLEAVAEVISLITSSPLGPPIVAAVAAMSALNLATASWAKVSSAAWAKNISGANGYVAAMGAANRAGFIAKAGVAALALGLQESATGFDASNAAMGVFAGSFLGPPGAAIGGGVGLLLDLAGAGGEVTDSLQRMDDAIARGNLDILERELEGLKRTYDDLTGTTGVGDFLGDQLSEIGLAFSEVKRGNFGDTFAGLEAGIARGETAVGRLRSGTVSLSDTFSAVFGPAVSDTREAFDLAASSADVFRGKIERLNRTLEGRAALRDYEAALDDFRAALKENGAIFDITRGKGREVVGALDDIAGAGIRFAETLKGQQRVDFLRGIREDLQAIAQRTPAARGEVKQLVGEIDKLIGKRKPKIEPEADTRPARRNLGLLRNQAAAVDGLLVSPKIEARTEKASGKLNATKSLASALDGMLVAPTVVANTGPAQMSIRNLRAQLSAIPDEMVYIRAQRLDAIRKEDGGTIPGPRFPYRDKMLIWAAPGEEVITNRNGEADQFRADRAAGRIPAYADGGQVSYLEGLRTQQMRGWDEQRPMVAPSTTSDVRVSGTATATLRTPWGDQQIEMKLRQIARDEYDAERRFDEVNA